MDAMVDLDINNYGYAELLALFNLETNYGEEELKQAKKIVLKMHPDKSKLPPEYFLFFSKAFKTIVQIYEFKNKSTKKNDPKNLKEYKELIQIVPKKGDDNSRALKKFIETNDMNDPLKFNKWFNEQFEKAKDDGPTDGYEDWFKANASEPSLSEDTVRNKEEMAQAFSKKKNDMRNIIKYEGVQELCANGLGACELYGAESSGGYSSSLFDTLSYQDLKQAHVETIIPVSESDYDAIPKFSSVDEYQRYRDSDREQMTPLTEGEAGKQLLSKERRLEEDSTRRAFYYANQVEENEKKTNTFWASIKQLTNF